MSNKSESENVKIADNYYHAGTTWILVEDGIVNICNQIQGQKPEGSVGITRKEFEKIIKFYQTLEP